MALKCEQYNRVCVVSTDGDFAGETVQAARKQFDEQIEQHQIVDFVVDMEKCSFVDSGGLEALLAMKQRCEELSGAFKLASVDENVRKILEITRLEHRFEQHADLPAALKSVR